MADSLVVRSKAKEFVSKRKMRLGGDAVEALSKECERILERAIERSKAAKAGTVKARHI